MPTYYNNALTTQNILADEKKVDMSTEVAQLAPRLSPFMLLANAPSVAFDGGQQSGVTQITFGTRTVKNFEFDWMEDELKSKATAINLVGGYGTGDTVLVVDDASIFLPGDTVLSPASGEVLRVDDRNTTSNTITVTRAFGPVAAAALADDAVLKITGNVNAENGRSRIYTNTVKTKKTNYIQTIRHTVEVTRMMQLTDTYSGDPRTYERAKVLREHLEDIEAALMFGKKYKGTEYGGSNVEYATGGLLEFAAGANAISTGVGTLTKATWLSWLKDLFKYGPNEERIIFASSTAAAAVAAFGGNNTSDPKATVLVANLEREFGMLINTYHTLVGVVHIIIHPLLTGSVYDGYMVAFDPSMVRMAVPEGGDRFMLYPDLQPLDQQGYKDEYRTDCGLEVRLTKTMGLMTGITG